MTKTSSVAAAVITALLVSTAATAHTDTIFPIVSNGFLQRFPDNYGPASLEIGPASAGEPDVPGSVVVRIGSNEAQLPRCVRDLLSVAASRKVRAHGSWYHDFSLLPPYLVLDFPEKADEHGGFEGYALMFSMKDGSLHEVQHWQSLANGGRRGTPVDPSTICDQAELASLAPQ